MYTIYIEREHGGYLHEWQVTFNAAYHFEPATWEEPEVEMWEVMDVKVDGVAGLEDFIGWSDDDYLEVYFQQAEEERSDEPEEPDYDTRLGAGDSASSLWLHLDSVERGYC